MGCLIELIYFDKCRREGWLSSTWASGWVYLLYSQDYVRTIHNLIRSIQSMHIFYRLVHTRTSLRYPGGNWLYANDTSKHNKSNDIYHMAIHYCSDLVLLRGYVLFYNFWLFELIYRLHSCDICVLLAASSGAQQPPFFC